MICDCRTVEVWDEVAVAVCVVVAVSTGSASPAHTTCTASRIMPLQGLLWKPPTVHARWPRHTLLTCRMDCESWHSSCVNFPHVPDGCPYDANSTRSIRHGYGQRMSAFSAAGATAQTVSRNSLVSAKGSERTWRSEHSIMYHIKVTPPPPTRCMMRTASATGTSARGVYDE